jgi:hypothetical protein
MAKSFKIVKGEVDVLMLKWEKREKKLKVVETKRKEYFWEYKLWE